MTIFTRPSRPDYDRVYALLEGYPTEHPVYGYVSDTGTEEVQAVARLSQAGRFLVPTNTTSNLSFHVAVAASAPRQHPPVQASAVEPCTTDRVNVVLSMSDGDNMALPIGNLPSPSNWGSSRRGEMPLGWSLGPPTAVLMPSVWDYYATTATSNDEIVGMMGLGYAYTSLLPNGADYFADSFAFDAAIGVRTHWSLDALLTQPESSGWSLVQQGAQQAGVKPDGILMNYIDFSGPNWYRTVESIPVLTSKTTFYEADPGDLGAQIAAIDALPPDQRPLVTFLSATIWFNSYATLADAVATLPPSVRLLTPAQATACLPPPPEAPPTPTTSPSPTSTTSGPSVTAPAVAVTAVPRFAG